MKKGYLLCLLKDLEYTYIWGNWNNHKNVQIDPVEE